MRTVLPFSKSIESVWIFNIATSVITVTEVIPSSSSAANNPDGMEKLTFEISSDPERASIYKTGSSLGSTPLFSNIVVSSRAIDTISFNI